MVAAERTAVLLLAIPGLLLPLPNSTVAPFLASLDGGVADTLFVPASPSAATRPGSAESAAQHGLAALVRGTTAGAVGPQIDACLAGGSLPAPGTLSPTLFEQLRAQAGGLPGGAGATTFTARAREACLWDATDTGLASDAAARKAARRCSVQSALAADSRVASAAAAHLSSRAHSSKARSVTVVELASLALAAAQHGSGSAAYSSALRALDALVRSLVEALHTAARAGMGISALIGSTAPPADAPEADGDDEGGERAEGALAPLPSERACDASLLPWLLLSSERFREGGACAALRQLPVSTFSPGQRGAAPLAAAAAVALANGTAVGTAGVAAVADADAPDASGLPRALPPPSAAAAAPPGTLSSALHLLLQPSVLLPDLSAAAAAALGVQPHETWRGRAAAPLAALCATRQERQELRGRRERPGPRLAQLAVAQSLFLATDTAGAQPAGPRAAASGVRHAGELGVWERARTERVEAQACVGAPALLVSGVLLSSPLYTPALRLHASAQADVRALLVPARLLGDEVAQAARAAEADALRAALLALRGAPAAHETEQPAAAAAPTSAAAAAAAAASVRLSESEELDGLLRDRSCAQRVLQARAPMHGAAERGLLPPRAPAWAMGVGGNAQAGTNGREGGGAGGWLNLSRVHPAHFGWGMPAARTGGVQDDGLREPQRLLLVVRAAAADGRCARVSAVLQWAHAAGEGSAEREEELVREAADGGGAPGHEVREAAMEARRPPVSQACQAAVAALALLPAAQQQAPPSGDGDLPALAPSTFVLAAPTDGAPSASEECAPACAPAAEACGSASLCWGALAPGACAQGERGGGGDGGGAPAPRANPSPLVASAHCALPDLWEEPPWDEPPSRGAEATTVGAPSPCGRAGAQLVVRGRGFGSVRQLAAWAPAQPAAAAAPRAMWLGAGECVRAAELARSLTAGEEAEAEAAAAEADIVPFLAVRPAAASAAAGGTGALRRGASGFAAGPPVPSLADCSGLTLLLDLAINGSAALALEAAGAQPIPLLRLANGVRPAAAGWTGAGAGAAEQHGALAFAGAEQGGGEQAAASLLELSYLPGCGCVEALLSLPRAGAPAGPAARRRARVSAHTPGLADGAAHSIGLRLGFADGRLDLLLDGRGSATLFHALSDGEVQALRRGIAGALALPARGGATPRAAPATGGGGSGHGGAEGFAVGACGDSDGGGVKSPAAAGPLGADCSAEQASASALAHGAAKPARLLQLRGLRLWSAPLGTRHLAVRAAGWPQATAAAPPRIELVSAAEPLAPGQACSPLDWRSDGELACRPTAAQWARLNSGALLVRACAAAATDAPAGSGSAAQCAPPVPTREAATPPWPPPPAPPPAPPAPPPRARAAAGLSAPPWWHVLGGRAHSGALLALCALCALLLCALALASTRYGRIIAARAWSRWAHRYCAPCAPAASRCAGCEAEPPEDAPMVIFDMRSGSWVPCGAAAEGERTAASSVAGTPRRQAQPLDAAGGVGWAPPGPRSSRVSGVHGRLSTDRLSASGLGGAPDLASPAAARPRWVGLDVAAARAMGGRTRYGSLHGAMAETAAEHSARELSFESGRPLSALSGAGGGYGGRRWPRARSAAPDEEAEDEESADGFLGLSRHARNLGAFSLGRIRHRPRWVAQASPTQGQGRPERLLDDDADRASGGEHTPHRPPPQRASAPAHCEEGVQMGAVRTGPAAQPRGCVLPLAATPRAGRAGPEMAGEEEEEEEAARPLAATWAEPRPVERAAAYAASVLVGGRESAPLRSAAGAPGSPRAGSPSEPPTPRTPTPSTPPLRAGGWQRVFGEEEEEDDGARGYAQQPARLPLAESSDEEDAHDKRADEQLARVAEPAAEPGQSLSPTSESTSRM